MEIKDRKLAYLAVPYSSPDSSLQTYRFRCANYVAGKLMERGFLVFSPISHTHPITISHKLPGNWEYWMEFDEAFISYSHTIFVLMLDGWRESKGVQAEIEIAKKQNIKIIYLGKDYLEGMK